MPIAIPLDIVNGKLTETTDEKKSIEQFLSLLVSSYQGSFLADEDFGFTLMNHRFENLDAMNTKTMGDDGKNKNIYGKSNNVEYYAYDLKQSIEKYERRLSDVTVEIKAKETFKAVININGKYTDKNGSVKNLTYNIDVNIW